MKRKLSNSLYQKTVTVMSVAILLLLNVFLWSTNESRVFASEQETEYTQLDKETYDAYAVATYAGSIAKTYVGSKAPEVEGYVFAGWYKEAGCAVEQAVKDVTEISESGTYYAKFVKEGVLSIKVQVSNGDVNKETQEVEKNMRFVSSVTDLAYKQIGFRMKYQDADGEWKYKINQGQVVYERISTATEGDEYEYSPKVVDTKSEYFMTATWKGEDNQGIKPEDYAIRYCVKAYWITMDGVKVYGPSRYISIADGLDEKSVSVSVKNTTWNTEMTDLTVAYGENGSASATVIYNDGIYAHLKISLGNGVSRWTELRSVTKFKITDNTGASEEVIYRNLYTTHVTEGTSNINADDTWYQIYNDDDLREDEYVIATGADLYGLVELANSGKNSFADKTIYMVSDIAVNDGDAEKWAAGTVASPKAWIPINGFAGTFDGGGHTISGLYVSGADGITGRGLFTKTKGATIRNLNVVNSFYKGNTSVGTGAIVGQGNGTFQNIYVDVIITDTASKGRIGGIIGQADGNVTVSNCWSACDITSNAPYCGGMLGNISATGYTITIEHCLNTGNLTSAGKEAGTFGGLVGRANTANPTGGQLFITDCLNVGVVKTVADAGDIGGLIGHATKAYASAGETVESTVITKSYCAVHSEDGVTEGTEKVAGKDSRTDKTGGVAIAYDKLMGNNANTNTELTFVTADTDGFWVIREDLFPMLAYFEK